MVLVILDTNIFLHYQPIEQINWAEVVQSKEITLVIPPIVIRELDKHKDQHRLSTIRERARVALKKVQSVVLDDSPIRLPDGVALFPASEPDIDFNKYSLRRDISDDHLIASCIACIETRPNVEVMLIAHDTGPIIKATQRGIRIGQLPERYKLPSAIGEVEKELRQLQQRVVELENQFPQLQLGFKGNDRYFKVVLPASTTVTDEEIEHKMSLVKKEYPKYKMEPLSEDVPEESDLLGIAQLMSMRQKIANMNSPSPKEIERYNNDLDVFYFDYENYLLDCDLRQQILNQTVCLNIFLFNQGTSPAEDIDVFMHFPDGFTLCEEDNLPAKPIEPRPPQPPRGPLDNLVEPSVISALHNFSNITPHMPALKGFSPLTIKKTNSYDVSFECQRLKQHLTKAITPLYVVFDSYEDASSFCIDYRINAANLPMEVEGQLHVVVSSQPSDN